MQTIKIAPSDFAFLYDRCRRCWYRKVHGLQKPKESLPKLYKMVDGGMKATIGHEQIRDWWGIPAKAVVKVEYITSDLIVFEDLGVQLYISGYVDKVFVLDDDDIGIFEFKMTDATPENVFKYSRQTHAYQLALERPAKGDPRPVGRIDLAFFQPSEGWSKFKHMEDGRVFFTPTSGYLIHHPVEMDRPHFQNVVLRELAEVAGSLDMPEASPECEFCATVGATVQFDVRLAKLAASAPAK
jgi:hypothetical protein